MNEEYDLDELMEEVNIKDDFRLSFSKISSFVQSGSKSLIKKKKLEGEGIRMGGLIDLLLFEKYKFKDTYYINTSTPPNKGTILDKVANYVLENYEHKHLLKILNDDNATIVDNLHLVKECLDFNLFGRIKDPDKIFDKLNNNSLWKHVKAIVEAKDKIIITAEEYDNALEIVDIILNHKHTKGLIKYDCPNLYYQFKAEFQYNGFNFLSFIDIVEIDDENKTIQLKDLKTGSKNYSDFMKSFLSYNYHFQAYLYQIAGEKIKEILKIENYKLKPFQFIYISRYERIPVVFNISQKWLDAAKKGFETPSGYKYMGVDEAIDLIEWHISNQVFDLPKDVYEANGIINLKDDFIKIS